MPKHKIISLGGSIVIPETGFNIKFLKGFVSLIKQRIKMGEKFVLIVGGGNTARIYQQAAKKVDRKISSKDLDWIGIQATGQNAKFVQMLFGKLSYREVVTDPTKKIKTSKPVIVAGGWKPGWSTDYDAVLLAEQFKAKELINVSNIDYVYTADPKKVKNAKYISELNWKEMKKIIGSKWTPGANLPLDPSATKKAAKLKLKVSFVKGSNLKDLRTVLDGKKIQGTIIE